MDLSAILENVAKWLSSGPVGIITGLFGLGVISAALYALSKWFDKKEYEGDLDLASRIAGEVSDDISDGMRRNRTAMEKAIEAERIRIERGNKITIEAPDEVIAGKYFTVTIRNLFKEKELYADKKWVLGYPQGGRNKTLAVRLTSAGKRTLDIQVSGEWVSRDITVLPDDGGLS